MLRLTPDSPEDTPRLPEGNTEITREPVEVLDIAGPLAIPDKAITVLRVKTGHFTVNVSINTLCKADRLVVTFMGSRGGGRDSVVSLRPMFARRQWDVLYRAPILAISDPQTEVDWDTTVPREGLYMGTFENDLVPELLALVNKVCDELGVDRNRVVMAGSLSGGTSALLVGSRRREATGILVTCPYLRPDKFRDQMVASVIRAMGGTAEDWQRVGEEQPWRNYPLTAMRDGINEGNDLRVVVAQNIRDPITINRHFPGLWRRFDIDPEGGVSANGRVMAALYDAAGATHGLEPPSMSRPLVELAYDFFDKPVEAITRRDKKKKLPGAQAGQEAQEGVREDAPAAAEAGAGAGAKAGAAPANKGQGKGQGQGKRFGQGKAAGQGQGNGQALEGKGQGQAKKPGQGQGQGQGQAKKQGQGLAKKQGEGLAKKQGQDQGQGKGQGQGQRPGQAKEHGHVKGQGGQGNGQGAVNGQGQGKGQGLGKGPGAGKGPGGKGPGKTPGQAKRQAAARPGEGEGEAAGV